MCLSGFEKVSDNMCKPCLIGFYSSQIGQLCIEAPKGAFLRFPGSTMFTICPQNWGLLTVKSSSYTTCVSGTFSSSQNTFCVPGAVVAVTTHFYSIRVFCINVHSVVAVTTHFYSIRVFCINVHSTSLRNGVLIMQKNSGISWDNSKDSINQYHPNFVKKIRVCYTKLCSSLFIFDTNRIWSRYVYDVDTQLNIQMCQLSSWWFSLHLLRNHTSRALDSPLLCGHDWCTGLVQSGPDIPNLRHISDTSPL